MNIDTVIYGPPGTGKTTRLISLVNRDLQSGIDAATIGFISFTRQAIAEAISRATQNIKTFNKFEFPYFKTIHALAFAGLNMRSKQMMSRRNYAELGELTGFEIGGNFANSQDYYALSLGDQLLFIISLARLRRLELFELWQGGHYDVTWPVLDYLATSLQTYKQNNGLVDFTDLLERYLDLPLEKYPSLQRLYVDEAQDLCRLQWEIISHLSDRAEITYVSGDDDQAIYRWAGADIEKFQSLNSSQKLVLKKSYRLPKRIFAEAERIRQMIRFKVAKEYLPREDLDGEIRYFSSIISIDFSIGNWLILVRNRYFASNLEDELRLMGYPFDGLYYSVLTDKGLSAAFNWERFIHGESLFISQFKEMVKYIDIDEEKLEKTSGLKIVNIENCRNIFSDKDLTHWYDKLDFLSSSEREYFLSIRRRGESLNKKPRILIRTIHGAKGMESENVVIIMDISRRTFMEATQSITQMDDELRVIYVAVTRASRSIYIIEPQTENYFPVELNYGAVAN